MEWTQDQILTIVQGIEKHRNLYVVKDPEYHNKNKRRSALETIVQELNIPGVTVKDIQKKWNGLRTIYAHEKKESSCIDENWYSYMHFLDEDLNIRNSKSSFVLSEKLPNEEPLHMSQNDEKDCTSLITSELESKTIEENVPTPRASGSALKKNDTPKRKRACAEDLQLDMAKTATGH
ncbi:hypothetical protein ILUMI_12096 [Ignelater luminosus]|uniref:MADF domain-containing protein n=1 Tax=Ignelater luminosus TaxID=2038154 RepID=A0A8K0CZ49_IGNLU|nr:hypothetical protein ILUMI_12096 [Ignelater luminosus]